MSYILNALRKSEQERQAIQPETMTDRILAQPHERRRGLGKWVAVAVVGNVLLIAGIIWAVQKMSGPPEARQVSIKLPVVKTVEKKAAKPIAETNELAKSVANNPPVPAQPSLGGRATASKPQENRLNSSAHQAAKLAPVPDSVAMTDKPSPPQAASSAIPAKPLAPKVPLIVSAEAKKPEAALELVNRIPFLDELPYEFRQTLPKMKINVFVYSTEPEERFVMINMVKYKAGQQTKDQVDIKEILPESFVVNYHGQSFQIGRP